MSTVTENSRFVYFNILICSLAMNNQKKSHICCNFGLLSEMNSACVQILHYCNCILIFVSLPAHNNFFRILRKVQQNSTILLSFSSGSDQQTSKFMLTGFFFKNSVVELVLQWIGFDQNFNRVEIRIPLTLSTMLLFSLNSCKIFT